MNNKKIIILGISISVLLALWAYSSLYRPVLYEISNNNLPAGIKEQEKLVDGLIEDIKKGVQINNSENITEDVNVDTSEWNTYQNEEFGFSIKYSLDEEVGYKTINSELGDVNNPVPGIYVDFLIIPLDDKDIKAKAERIMGAFIKEAQTKSIDDYKGPSISCTSEFIDNETAKITFIECLGSGGIARYAYVDTEKIDFFIDGYSSEGSSRYKKSEEIKASIASMVVSSK